jgi:hypothetical protein
MNIEWVQMQANKSIFIRFPIHLFWIWAFGDSIKLQKYWGAQENDVSHVHQAVEIVTYDMYKHTLLVT